MDKITEEPFVSVVIVNYNAKKYLEDCIYSILNSDYQNIEIIAVDNGSDDGSLDFLQEILKSKSNVDYIRNEENIGPAAARNQGIRKVNGEYVAFLDNGTTVHPLWLKKSIKFFEDNPRVGACHCKLILSDTDNILDCVGEYLGQYGFLVNVVTSGEEKDVGQYNKILKIFTAKSAGMIVRMDALKKIEGFDDDYFIYFEESDLSWRIWLQGSEIVFIPDSIVYHKFGTSSIVLPERINYLVKFHGTKNYISTLIKNLGTKNLFKIIPILIAMWLGKSSIFLLKGQFKSTKWILQEVLWNFLTIKIL
ncbi:MAG: glycosyltransferase family 2 protein [Thermotogota bacterium]|nr:glycosyltransferase family 2 protein [Thermotogota bacterium]